MDSWLKLYEAITKPLPVTSSLFLVILTSFLFFSPDRIVARLGLLRSHTDYRWLVGALFITGSTWLVVTAVFWVIRLVQNKLAYHKERQRMEAEIRMLSALEREIIGCLLRLNDRVFTNTPDCGYANTLVAKKIVVPIIRANMSFRPDEVPFVIPIYVWEILKKHESEFPSRYQEGDPHPWRIPWLAR